MGTITRTFANNITTSGVFKPTAFNNASFDNVTAVPDGAVTGAGASDFTESKPESEFWYWWSEFSSRYSYNTQ